LPITNGGTGQTTANPAFNALAPTTTKGDLIAYSTVNARLPVGSNTQVLSADSTQTTGLKWVNAATSTLNQFNVNVGDSTNTQQATDTSLLGDIKASYATSTVTITIASPGVVSWTSHPFATGDKTYLTTTGALPTGLSASTTYWVIKVNANSYQLATTLANAVAGTAINTSGSQSGVHTAYAGGFKFLATGIPGKTDGAAVTAGYVGEKINGSCSDTNISGITNVCTVSLTPGVWMTYAVSTYTFATLATFSYFKAAISSANNTLPTGQVVEFTGSGTTALADVVSVTVPPQYINVSANTTYYLNVNASGSGTGFQGINNVLYAVRIN
jgi:hypothetical protein